MSGTVMERLESAASSLRREILQLKEEYKENKQEIAFLSSANVQNALMSSQENKGDESRTKMSRNLNTKLVHYEMQVKFFQQTTGIEVQNYFKRTEQKRENEVLYNHKMIGLCQDLPFELEFKTIESQSEQRSECRVSHISVQMDCQTHPSLLQLVHRTETTMDLLGFFRSLSHYAEWSEFHRNTFIQFKERYPAAVRLPLGPSGDHMILMNTDFPQCQMLLVWKNTISDEGTVVPILDLLTKIPEQVADRSGVLEEASSGFKNLLQVFGIEQSIDKIIQSFCLQRANPQP